MMLPSHVKKYMFSTRPLRDQEGVLLCGPKSAAMLFYNVRYAACLDYPLSLPLNLTA